MESASLNLTYRSLAVHNVPATACSLLRIVDDGSRAYQNLRWLLALMHGCVAFSRTSGTCTC